MYKFDYVDYNIFSFYSKYRNHFCLNWGHWKNNVFASIFDVEQAFTGDVDGDFAFSVKVCYLACYLFSILFFMCSFGLKWSGRWEMELETYCGQLRLERKSYFGVLIPKDGQYSVCFIDTSNVGGLSFFSRQKMKIYCCFSQVLLNLFPVMQLVQLISPIWLRKVLFFGWGRKNLLF